MNVLFSLTNLELGGAQVFATRLANELDALGHNVFIYDHWPEHRSKGLLATIKPGVRVKSFSKNRLVLWLVWKLNAVFKTLHIHPQWRHSLNKKTFEQFVRASRIEVINSHMSFSDFVVTSAKLPPGCKVVLSLHGEFEMLMQGKEEKELNIERIIRAINKSSAIIYTAEKNLAAFGLPGVNQNVPKTKINVGFSETGFTLRNVSRKHIGWSQDDFVVGMVSRGIPEKGWDICISVINAINKSGSGKIKLLLIGEGDSLKNLVLKANSPDIVLLQFGDDFQDYFSYYRLMDVFLFPTRFKGESVPNVVIESLYWGVPVIATAIAEIPSMLLCDSQNPAGICVPPNDNREELISALCHELGKFISDRSYRSRFSVNCAKAFAQFSMEDVSKRYLNVFLEPA